MADGVGQTSRPIREMKPLNCKKRRLETGSGGRTFTHLGSGSLVSFILGVFLPKCPACIPLYAAVAGTAGLATCIFLALAARLARRPPLVAREFEPSPSARATRKEEK